METKTDLNKLATAWFDPLAGLEAASQWNAAAIGWMTKGFQQWMSLMTAPFGSSGLFVTPDGAREQVARIARFASNALDSRLRGNDLAVHAMARAETKPHRTASDKPRAADASKPKRSARAKKAASKPRARG